MVIQNIMNNNVITNIIRIGFAAWIIFELLNWIGVLNFTLDFTWLGLVVTAVFVWTALEIVSHTTVFTTHTPVPAAFDEYSDDLIKPFFQNLEEQLGVKETDIVSLGKISKSDPNAPFSPFVLGLHMTQHCNGVSRLHGQVARRMWSSIWPGRPEEEIPISHITNGIHIPTWVSEQISMLFERYIGPEWNLHPWNPDMIKRIGDIYDEELWRAHEMSRSRLIRMCRQLVIKQYQRRNEPRATIEDMERVLDQDILTIAFARRFATYKRYW